MFNVRLASDSSLGAKTAAFGELYNECAHCLVDNISNLLTVDEGKKIVDAAAEWKDTPYADEGTEHAGPNATINVAGDCGGISHDSYQTGGFDYHYKTANQFAATSGDGHFVKVDQRQMGDMVSWHGVHHHLAIYAGNGMMWTTHEHGNNKQFGLSTVQSFTREFGKEPDYYRYRKDS